MDIKRLIIVTVFVLIGMNSYAQHNTTSPYSMFGIGEIESGGFGRSRALGGSGIALPSQLSLNNINPASYNSIDSMHFIFEVGLNSTYSHYTYNDYDQNKYDASFAYLAMGFRMNRWWATSIGMKPYSNVGYTINTEKQITGANGAYADITLTGSGGLDQFYWGNSFKVYKHLSLGVNVSYLYGTILKSEAMAGTSSYNAIQVEDEAKLNNFCFNFGAQYLFKLNTNWSGTLGAVYGNKTRLNERQSFRVLYGSDTIYTERKQYGNFYVPQNYGFGALFNYKNSFLITGDYTQNNWSGTNSAGELFQLVDARKGSVGVEIIPSAKASARFYEVLHYRLGGYYGNSYLKVGGQQLKDYGITAGVGVPFMRGKTIINLAFSAGITGVPTDNSIINEFYYKVHLNVTLFDFWFNKAKYD
jgi:hypothetical protein